jgi:hypothetical protein
MDPVERAGYSSMGYGGTIKRIFKMAAPGR